MRGKKRTWILIADGARARILATEGRGTGLRPATDATYEADHRPTREIGSDRPGRVFESADGSRHAYAPRVDWHQYEKHLFAKKMAAVLDGARKRGDFEALVLVAPPKALGELRAALDSHTLAKVSAELAKDITNVRDHDIGPYLSGMVRF